jgi:hypothetical protein
MKGMRPWHSYENSERYESLFPPLPDFVAHRVLRLRELQIGLSKSAPNGVVRPLLAGLIGYRLGIGLSYAEKRYATDPTQSRWLGLTDTIDRLFDRGQNRLRLYVSFGLDAEKKPGSYQDLSMQFFYRNVIGFDAAKRLSELGYLCEVASILRTALEQFAFCANLWEFNRQRGSEIGQGLELGELFQKLCASRGKVVRIII